MSSLRLAVGIVYNLTNISVRIYIYMPMELRDYFRKDLPPRQRQYEAIRAVAFGEGAIKNIAERFRYTPQTLRMLINRLVHGKLQLFPEVKRGPKRRHIPSETETMVIQLRRKKMLNSREITEALKRSTISISVRTVERILGASRNCVAGQTRKEGSARKARYFLSDP